MFNALLSIGVAVIGLACMALGFALGRWYQAYRKADTAR